VLLWLLFSDMSAFAFFTDRLTLAFIGRNGLLIGGAYLLPGIFTDVPNGGVNGSLWTIPYEVKCYIGLALLAALGLAQPRSRLTMLIVAAIVIHLALPEDLVPVLMQARRLSFAFFLGVLVWLWRDHVSLSWPLAVVGAGAALLVPAGSAAHLPAMQVGFGYLVMVTAFRAPSWLRQLSQKLPDYSYGIYIYAFPAQQVALALGASEPVANIALGFALMLPFAALSWHLVEGPALARKRRPLP
jgi:peptidoglycan/LPS O-acetylase OafA/YrhL